MRYLAGAVAAGLGAGLLAAGAGGRLVMRLLAVTSPDAEGSLTEANGIVGEITLEGTLGFIVFNGIAVGMLSAVLCVLLRPVLPRGLAGGAVPGALMLVVVGSRVDPLRADNFDFNRVGRTWLAVFAFTVLALFQGKLTIALAARFSAPPPLTGRPLTAGRIAVAGVAIVALPGFIGAVAEIT